MSEFNVGADFSSTAKIYIEHRTLGVLRDKDGNPGWLEIKSNKHPDLIRLENKAKQEGIIRQNKRNRGVVDDVGLEEIEGKSLDYLCAALVDWRVINLAGEHINAPCSDENKRKILSDPNWQFLRDCLDKGIVEDEVFMPNSKLYSRITQETSSSLE